MSISYLAGLVSSDGHLEKNRPYVYVYTKNKKFKDFVVRLIRKLPGKRVTSKFRHRCFQIRVWSKNLYKMLNTLYKIEKGKKSHKLVAPVWLSVNEQLQFLQGFLDGDSSIFKETKTEKRKSKNVKYSYPVIELGIKSQEIAEWSKTIIEKFKIKVSRVYKKK